MIYIVVKNGRQVMVSALNSDRATWRMGAEVWHGREATDTELLWVLALGGGIVFASGPIGEDVHRFNRMNNLVYGPGCHHLESLSTE